MTTFEAVVESGEAKVFSVAEDGSKTEIASQPCWPNGMAWADDAEALAWATQAAAAQDGISDLPGLSPEQPVISRVDVEAAAKAANNEANSMAINTSIQAEITA